jgi:parallel beta-helix repeat protein
MMRARVSRTVLAVLSAVLLAAGVLVAGATVASADAGHDRPDGSLYVSPTGSAGNDGTSCHSASYSTIQSAVDAASPGANIVVCEGTYSEDVVVSTPVSLHGRSAVLQGAPTTDATCEQIGPNGPGSAPCLAALTIKASNVEVDGFTVQGAVGEGILATGSLENGSISDITIRHNQVVNNDTGGGPNASTTLYPQCQVVGEIPGDCGEAIHLMGVFNSQVRNNYVSGNSGGILLTDEFGPTHDNVVEGNTVTKNQFDCGITVPGHNPMALSATGERQPWVAGVFDNQIRGNIVTDNGLLGEGAGVLFADAGPGTASYDNVVEGNYLAGNELSGVTMHAHTLPPGQFEDMSGNKVVGNVIGTNNLGSQQMGPGDPLDGTVQDPETTGVLVFSGTVPVQVTIHNNVIYDDHYGIWLGLGGNVQADVHDNIYPNTAVPVFTAPAAATDSTTPPANPSS